MIAKLRKAIPDICLRTTLITGFPGEKREDHEELLSFVNEMEFDNSLDIVVVARPQAKDRSYQEIESALMHLAEKHHITGKNNDEKISDQDN